MGYGPRKIHPTCTEMPLTEWVDAATDVFYETNVRIGPDYFAGTPALDHRIIDTYGVFDWDPCDGGPSGQVYRDIEYSLTETTDVPERVTWNGETYEFSCSLGCLTEYDDQPDGRFFDVTGGVPATSAVEENQYGHPKAIDRESGLVQLAWYQELVGVSAVANGIDATGGLWWRGEFFSVSETDAKPCDCCGEPIPNAWQNLDAGVVTAWETPPGSLDDPWGSDAVTAELCLYCAAETFGLSFDGDDRLTEPEARETMPRSLRQGGDQLAMSKPVYVERNDERERLRAR